MGRAIGIANAIGFRVGSKVNLLQPPTNLVSSFNVDTISGELAWTDNSGGTAEYEVYSSFDGGDETLLTTTAAGATSYADAMCKQNASVVYRIRGKKGAAATDFVQAAALATPLCWKTDQSVLTSHVINTLNIAAGKTVTVNYSDGTSQAYTGNNSNITKNFASTGQYNVWLSGDTASITDLRFYSQSKTYGDVSKWILSEGLLNLLIHATSISGLLEDFILPSTLVGFYGKDTLLSGGMPIMSYGTTGMDYQVQNCAFTHANFNEFKLRITSFQLSQFVVFPTEQVDKVLKALADFFDVNTPLTSLVVNLSGPNMGIPTGGSSNADLTRLVGYYTAAGFTCSVLIRTS